MWLFLSVDCVLLVVYPCFICCQMLFVLMCASEETYWWCFVAVFVHEGFCYVLCCCAVIVLVQV